MVPVAGPKQRKQSRLRLLIVDHLSNLAPLDLRERIAKDDENEVVLGQNGYGFRHSSRCFYYEIRAQDQSASLEEHPIPADDKNLRMSVHGLLTTVTRAVSGESAGRA